MTAIPFDTLKLARTLRDKAHFAPEQAEGVADALADAFQEQIATRADIVSLKSDVSQLEARMAARLEALELRLAVKMGGMLILAVGGLAALIRLS